MTCQHASLIERTAVAIKKDMRCSPSPISHETSLGNDARLLLAISSLQRILQILSIGPRLKLLEAQDVQEICSRRVEDEIQET